jgi:hypothetical protein
MTSLTSWTRRMRQNGSKQQQQKPATGRDLMCSLSWMPTSQMMMLSSLKQQQQQLQGLIAR